MPIFMHIMHSVDTAKSNARFAITLTLDISKTFEQQSAQTVIKMALMEKQIYH